MKHEPDRWKADYERDGYLVVEDCLDASTLALLREKTDDIQKNIDALPPGLRRHISLETDFAKTQPDKNDLPPDKLGKAIKLVMELPAFDRAFSDLIMYQPLLDVLETIFGSTEFAFHNYKAIIKAPHVSSAFVWHRDLPYLEHSTPNLITAMLCLDDMTEANGATVVLPGTHRVPHESVGQQDVAIPEDKLPKDAKRVTVTCPAGSAVLFHVNIIHGGGANRSSIPRRNLISIWSGPDTYPVNPWRYAYQDLMPRSKDPARQKQVRMTFPHLFR
jgi:ectoine hydroxylase-related dioxygenase (phytanoyl-CoA dioxygenase family)